MRALVLTVLLGAACDAAEWNYGNPEAWPSNYPLCGGSSQSPIDLTDPVVDPSGAFTRPDGWFDGQEGVVINKGYTVQFNLDNSGPILTKSQGTYDLVQLHLHWSNSSKAGAEHQVEGVEFPMELHLVHKNTKYNNLTEALGHDDGLAVVGILFKVASEENPGLEDLDDVLSGMKDSNSASAPHNLKVCNFMPRGCDPKATCDCFFYKGSLTTPTCNEVVDWNVLQEATHISERQFNIFRSLIDINNYRPVQPLNGRRVSVTAPLPVKLPANNLCPEGKVKGDCDPFHVTTVEPNEKCCVPNCQVGDGKLYAGTIAKTKTGLTCQNWMAQSPHEHRFGELGNNNHCRNPDGEPGAWCYTTDPKVRFALCEVPECPEIVVPIVVPMVVPDPERECLYKRNVDNLKKLYLIVDANMAIGCNLLGPPDRKIGFSWPMDDCEKAVVTAQRKCSNLTCFVQEMAECHNHTEACRALTIGFSGAFHTVAIAAEPEWNNTLCNYWHFGHCLMPIQRAYLDCKMDMSCTEAIAKVSECEKCVDAVETVMEWGMDP